MANIKISVEGAAPANNSFWVPLDQIEVDRSKNYGRFKEPNREEVRKSIIEDGQRKPVDCIRLKPSNKLKLVAGYGRYDILDEFNKTATEPRKILIQVIDGNEKDAILANLTENINSPRSFMDQACALKAMRELLGMTDTEISAKYGFDAAWISQRNTLLSLEPEIQQSVADGVMALTAALALAKIETQEERLVVHATAVAALPQPEPAAEGEPPKKRGKRAPIGPSQIAEASTINGIDPKMKRTYADIKEFWTVMIGSPAISLELQRIAKICLDLIDGINEDFEEVERLEVIVTALKSGGGEIYDNAAA